MRTCFTLAGPHPRSLWPQALAARWRIESGRPPKVGLVRVIIRSPCTWRMRDEASEPGHLSSIASGGRHRADQHIREEQRDQAHDERECQAVPQGEQEQLCLVVAWHARGGGGDRDALE